MTANLSIQTAYAANVIVIPQRTITEKDGIKTVEVLVDERKQTTETRTITTGLVGDGGLVEVTSGLAAGERVVFNQ
jgi:multidrug efflux pump subunit AcrA (membrane-fusion protein)